MKESFDAAFCKYRESNAKASKNNFLGFLLDKLRERSARTKHSASRTYNINLERSQPWLEQSFATYLLLFTFTLQACSGLSFLRQSKKKAIKISRQDSDQPQP
jgi:hypothetical protein